MTSVMKGLLKSLPGSVQAGHRERIIFSLFARMAFFDFLYSIYLRCCFYCQAETQHSVSKGLDCDASYQVKLEYCRCNFIKIAQIELISPGARSGLLAAPIIEPPVFPVVVYRGMAMRRQRKRSRQMILYYYEVSQTVSRICQSRT